MSKASLKLLGPFEARGVDGAVIALPTKKCQALAAVLAVANGASVSRDRLLGLLWGEKNDEAARHSLSQALTSLRRTIGAGAVVASRDSVRLDVDAISIDTSLFLSEIAFADAASLDLAATRLRGELLQDFTLRESPFEDWLADERTHFANLASDAMYRRGVLAITDGDERRALDAFASVLVIDPVSEPAHLALMRLHLDHGRPSMALRQYTAAAERLFRDLDAAPGNELEVARQEAEMRSIIVRHQAINAGEIARRRHATALAVSIWPISGMENDLEDMQLQVSSAFRAVVTEARQAGAHIVSSTPDGFLSVFGISTTIEDHAVRACRTALSIRAMLDGLNPASISGQIALDSGELLLRTDPDGVAEVFGSPLQRVLRIVALAHAPHIAVTDVVRRLVRSRFSFGPSRPVTLFSGEAHVALFQLAPPGEDNQEWEPTAFVGRSWEISQLSAACNAAEGGAGQLVAVVGEPGVGKSRLAREFMAKNLPTGWRAIVARTDPQFTESAYFAVRSLLQAYFEIGSLADVSTVRQTVTSLTSPLGETGALLALPILALLGCEPLDADWDALEPRMRHRRLVNAVIQLLHRRSEVTPLFIVLEDLHWLDGASKDLIEELVATLPAARITILANFRPELKYGWAGRSNSRIVRLEPLPSNDATSMLDVLVGMSKTMDFLKSWLAERTGGNPFFLEECVRTLAASEALIGVPGDYRLTHTATEPVLPDSVHAVIGARVDRMRNEDKQLLQIAAVIGTQILAPLLETVAGRDVIDFEGVLLRLIDEEFLIPERMIPVRTLRFKHALTLEVILRSLVKQDRRDLHARVLAALEATRLTTGSETIESLAHHALGAEDWQKVIEYSSAAGIWSVSQNADRAAVGHFTRALDALAKLPATPAGKSAEIDLHLRMRESLIVTGEHDHIAAHLDLAATIAAEIGDKSRLGRANLALSGLLWVNGQHSRALRMADDLLLTGLELNDRMLVAQAHYRKGSVLGALGQYRESVLSLCAAKDILTNEGLSDVMSLGGYPIVFCDSWLAWGLAELGDTEAAHQVGKAGWDSARRLTNNYTRSVMGFGYGEALIRMGCLAEARDVLEDCIALHEIAAIPSTYPFIAAPLGYLLVALGEIERGFAYLFRANSADVRRMAPIYAHINIWLGEAQLVVGEIKAARTTLLNGLEIARANGERGHEAWALRCLGDVVSATDLLAADSYYDASAEIARQLGMQPLLAAIDVRRKDPAPSFSAASIEASAE